MQMAMQREARSSRNETVDGRIAGRGEMSIMKTIVEACSIDHFQGKHKRSKIRERTKTSQYSIGPTY
jgi:hypothetical protein